ncbi:polyprotein, partial [Haplosporangium sp. Z 27]
ILPGFEKYTPEQIFFIQWGHIWCDITRPESYEIFTSDVHSPPNWRINGVMRNLDYFAEAFKCEPHTFMNPVDKCTLW